MSKRLLTAAAACALAGAMMIGGTFAYLSDKDEKDNTFTVGNIDISLSEEFDEKSAENIVPNQEIKKVPTVQNDGTHSAIVFMTVTVPKDTVITADGEGNKATTATKQNLFKLLTKDGADITDADSGTGTNWTLLETTDEDSQTTYLYGYKTKLDPNTTTDALMSKVKLINLVEGQLDQYKKKAEDGTGEKIELEIPIKVYAIQADGIQDINTDDGLSVDEMKQIYTIYLNTAKTDSSTTTSET